MGLGSLNPFKKSSSKGNSLEVPDNNLAPTKSTSSIANSIRSIKDGYKHATEDGASPQNLTNGFDLDKDGKHPLPALNNQNYVGNLDPTGLSLANRR